MNKQKLIEVFEEVLKNWEMSQSSVIQEGNVDDCDYEELDREVEYYRKKFLEALTD
ncbi:hypothetical protein [Cytobacillus oceanisediminis]|uniref:hypothetical protein n=1 Tax=Cytobacillus oceanisediminis TaxID=665099 RepID=UPI0037367F40